MFPPLACTWASSKETPFLALEDAPSRCKRESSGCEFLFCSAFPFFSRRGVFLHGGESKLSVSESNGAAFFGVPLLPFLRNIVCRLAVMKRKRFKAASKRNFSCGARRFFPLLLRGFLFVLRLRSSVVIVRMDHLPCVSM